MVSREHMQQLKEFTTGRVCARIFLDIVKVVRSVRNTGWIKRKFIEQSLQTWGTTHGIHFHGPGW